jgi:hypothetical protein
MRALFRVFIEHPSYFKDSLDSNKTNSKNLWKTLKNLGLPPKSVQSNNIGLNIDDEVCFHKLILQRKSTLFIHQ